MANHHAGCQHFGDQRAALRRGFSDPAAMERAIIDAHNEAVGHDDTVYIHGDFFLGGVRQLARLVPQLHGHLILIAGNNDLCWPGRARHVPASVYRDAGFTDVHTDAAVPHRIAGIDVVLSHFPRHSDTARDDRYIPYRPTADDPRPLICAHVHDHWRRRYGGTGRQHRNQINVSIDAWGLAPVPESTLMTLLTQIEQAPLP